MWTGSSAFCKRAAALVLGSCALFGQTYTIKTFTSGYPSGFSNAYRDFYGDLAVDSTGNLYYAVSNAVFKTSHGVTTQVAGEGTIFVPHYYSGLGIGADGSVYISSADNGCDVVKILNGVVTKFAGHGTVGGFSGDGGPATDATLSYPKNVAEDSAGRVYIADGGNNRVRMVSNGIITTVAGNGGGMNLPWSVAVDSAGTLYIADSLSDRVLKLLNGALVTVAGTGAPGYSGDGGPATKAQLNDPTSIALDAAGNLYIADVKNNRIRKVSGGVITTIAGDGTPGFRGDNGPATSAWLNGPRSVGVDAAGNVYVSDTLNERIRVLTPTLRSRNSASYATVTAPDMIAFGESTDLLSPLIIAPAVPWPATLGDVSLTITDSRQQTFQAPIYFVQNGQFGYLVPGAAVLGPATLELTQAGVKSSAPINIERVAPGLYTANSDGAGVAAGLWIRVAADGAQTWGYLFDPAKPEGNRAPVPVDLGGPGDSMYLSLYGTGFRGASSVSATVGEVPVPVYGFTPVSQYEGEDQVTIGPLPSSLAGHGETNILLTFDGKLANTVTGSIR